MLNPNQTSLKITENKSAKTFTIRKYDYYGKLIVKYRTTRQSAEDFQSLQNNTLRDWEYFLRTTSEYYQVI